MAEACRGASGGEAREAKGQCALSTLRNLLRDEEAPVKLLVENRCAQWRGGRAVPLPALRQGYGRG